VDVRAVARRALLPAALLVAVAAAVVLAGGQAHAFSAALRRLLDVSPVWIAVGAVFECVSIAGYIGLLALVAGRATPRVGVRESAQITLTGAAATRLLPTAGAGGAAVTVWALRRAGLGTQAVARTLIAFNVLLYAAFLTAAVASGTTLALGLVHSHGPLALIAVPTAAAVLTIGLALALALRSRVGGGTEPRRSGSSAKARQAADIAGGAVRDAVGLVRSRDVRLAGAVVYWGLDAAVLWAMLHAFGSPPAIPVVALAYLIGQVANTVPLPGTVTGGMVGVLIAFGVSPALALPAVLAYRTVAVWLPTPAALVAAPGLRATVARWGRERSKARPPVAEGCSAVGSRSKSLIVSTRERPASPSIAAGLAG
jgi:putative heme transporter